MNHLDFTIRDEAGTGVTFASGTIWLTFVCKVPAFSADLVASQQYALDVEALQFQGAYTTGIPGIDIRK